MPNNYYKMHNNTSVKIHPIPTEMHSKEVPPRRRVIASRDDGCSRSATLLPFLPPGLRPVALRPTLLGGLPFRAFFYPQIKYLNSSADYADYTD